MTMTISEALDRVEAGTRAVRALAELGPNDGACREAMARFRADVAALEDAVHRADASDRHDASATK